MKKPFFKVIRRAATSESGYTLVEVMIAMTILGIGLMSIAVAQLTAMKMSSRSRNLQQAMFLAREQMDSFEALLPGAAVLQANGVIADPANPIQVGRDAGDATRYTRTTTVTANNPSVNLALVRVTVSWNSVNTVGTNQVQLTSVKRMN